mgnify:CR=1 FL=1
MFCSSSPIVPNSPACGLIPRIAILGLTNLNISRSPLCKSLYLFLIRSFEILLDTSFNGSNVNDQYTLFAPNNMAFSRFLMDAGFNNIDDVPVEILINRLKERKRETEQEIKSRLSGATEWKLEEEGLHHFTNDQPIELSIKSFVSLLNRIS